MDETQKSEEDLFAEIYTGIESEPEPESTEQSDGSQQIVPEKEEPKEEPKEDYKKLLEERDVKIAELEQKNRSILGRVPNLQVELAQLKRELAETRQRVTGRAADTPRDGQRSEAAKTAALAGLSSPKWQQYKRDYPEEAEGIEQLLGPQQQQIQELRQHIGELTQNIPGLVNQYVAPIHERFHDESVHTLTAKHPDWDQHLTFKSDGSVEHMSPEFASFFWALNPDDRQSIQWHELGDCMAVMDAFKDYSTQQEKVSVAAASIAAANEKRENRKKTLAQSVSPSVRGEAFLASIDPAGMSEEDYFAHIMSGR